MSEAEELPRRAPRTVESMTGGYPVNSLKIAKAMKLIQSEQFTKNRLNLKKG